jgi:hypothetical protein
LLPLIFWRPDLTISCDQTWVASAN